MSAASTVSTESDMEPKEVSTASDLELPEIIIREVLTVDQIIKEKGYINIFEENFLGYLQGLLKNRSKAEIFNDLYERYRLPRPEEECYLPILANLRDTIERRRAQMPDDEQVDLENADEFTRIYMDFRRKKGNLLTDAFALPLLNTVVPVAGPSTSYKQPRPRQEACIEGSTEDIVVLRQENAGIQLQRVGTAYREPTTTENSYLADRQRPRPTGLSTDIPTFESALEEITPNMEIHEIIVLLEKRGFPLFHLSTERFAQLKERLAEPADLPDIPDYGAADATPRRHEDRIREYWDILRRAVESVSSRVRNRPQIDAPEEWPAPPMEIEVGQLREYKLESYKKFIKEIYDDYRASSSAAEGAQIAWDKFIEPWIKYVYSYEFQFVKLYNELEEIKISEDTQNYLGSIYDLDGIVADIGAAVDAVDDDIGDEDPFREFEYPDGEEEGPGIPMEAEAAEPPPDFEPPTDPALKYDVIEENVIYTPGTLANDIFNSTKTFLQYWIYYTGLSKYFHPDLLELALRNFNKQDSREEKLKKLLALHKFTNNYKFNFNNYSVNNQFEKPTGIKDSEWKIVVNHLTEAEDYLTDARNAFIVDLAYRWANHIYERYILEGSVIHPEIQMTRLQYAYWDPYGYPIKSYDGNMGLALLKPGLLKYLSITAQQVAGNNAYFLRNIMSYEGMDVAQNTENQHKYFSKFEYDLFARDYSKIIQSWSRVSENINTERLLQEKRCNGMTLVHKYIDNYYKKDLGLFDKKLDPEIATEYAKIYRCLAAMILSQTPDREGLVDLVDLYNKYMLIHYHKGRMIQKIGADFIPDSDWLSRIRMKGILIRDATARILLLIKNKIKYNRLAFIPKYRLALYSPPAGPVEEEVEPTPMVAQVPVANLEEAPAPDFPAIEQRNISEIWEPPSNRSVNYTYYRTLSKRLLSIAYNDKNLHTANSKFNENLNTVINMHKQLSENMPIEVLSAKYRDLCILTMYLNNDDFAKKIIQESVQFYKTWTENFPRNYADINEIITEQREKNKVKQLEEYDKIGQEQANLQKELINFGFKK